MEGVYNSVLEHLVVAALAVASCACILQLLASVASPTFVILDYVYGQKLEETQQLERALGSCK